MRSAATRKGQFFVYFELDAFPDALERAAAALARQGLLWKREGGDDGALILGGEEPSTRWTLTLEGDDEVQLWASELQQKWPRRAERAPFWDGRFVASSDDLEAALADYDIFFTLQETLGELVDGYVFLEWNGQLMERSKERREGRGAALTWPVLDEDETQQFNRMVRDELDERKLSYELEEGVVRLRDGSRTFGLQNLAQTCRKTPKSRWSTVVARHFRGLFKLQADEAELDAKVRDFDAIKERLRVRLSDREGAKGEMTRRVTRGLYAELVLDAPSYLRSVARTEARAWRRSEDGLFQVALKNVALDDPGQDVAGGEPRIVESRSSSYHHASRALGLSDSARDGLYGLLFIVPNRHVLSYHVIEDKTMFDAATALMSRATPQYRGGPGSISPHLFWMDRKGQIACISRPRSDRPLGGAVVELDPTPEFARDVLDRFLD